MSDIRINPETLRTHAGHVEATAGDIDQAAAAVASCTDDAFGLLCSFLPPILNTFWPTSTDAIRKVADGLRQQAQTLRTTANDFEDTDRQVGANADKHRAHISAM